MFLCCAWGSAEHPSKLFPTEIHASMSWSCHGSNHTEMIAALHSKGKIQSREVHDAMLMTDRQHYFVPEHVGAMAAEKMRSYPEAYRDRPQPIGHNATISAPHMHAMQLEILKDCLGSGKRALDVGSGSGYITACMARMVGSTGRVVGIDHIPELVRMSVDNVNRDERTLISNGVVQLICGDGRKGAPEHAPFDAIHVGAAAPELPAALTEQLAPGGRLVCPVGQKGVMQDLVVVDKDASGRCHSQSISQVIFIPLCDAGAQLDKNNSTKVDFSQLRVQK